MNKKSKQNIVFSISGGVGKNVIATVVANSIREQYPNAHITIATAHTQVWSNNPDIDACINFISDTDFYKDHIKDKDVLYFANDPYLHQNYIHKKEHLNQTWCTMFGIKYNNSLPRLYFTKEENESVLKKLPQGKRFFIQVSGGASNQEFPISWTRDIPLKIAQNITDQMKKNGYEIIQIRRKDQYALEGVPWIGLNIREMMCSLQFADKLLLIDSVAQHASVAVNKKATVLWVGHIPEIFGYPMHHNIKAKKIERFRHKIDSYLDTYNMTGTLHECPYDTNDIFDEKEILKSLE